MNLLIICICVVLVMYIVHREHVEANQISDVKRYIKKNIPLLFSSLWLDDFLSTTINAKRKHSGLHTDISDILFEIHTTIDNHIMIEMVIKFPYNGTRSKTITIVGNDKRFIDESLIQFRKECYSLLLRIFEFSEPFSKQLVNDIMSNKINKK